jgi:enterochelin esterase family protein
MPMDVDTHVALALDQPTPARVNGRSNGDIQASLNHAGDAAYHPCPEAFPDASVPAGSVTKYKDWDGSQIFANTLRDIYVYTPANLDPNRAAQLILFNDGFGYVSRRGAIRAPQVLDSLHARGEIDPTVAVFVNPGRPNDAAEASHDAASPDAAMRQRSFEYDSLTPDYGTFLLEEVLPFVAREQRLAITDDPDRRMVCGISSGGICAFTVAWLHTDRFRCVLSHCGSFTNIRGGHNYPYLIRTTPRKPLRVYLTSGANDAETLYGNWPLANKAMDDALRYAGYAHRFEFGEGGHSLRHGGALFADSLRWLLPRTALSQTGEAS